MKKRVVIMLDIDDSREGTSFSGTLKPEVVPLGADAGYMMHINSGTHLGFSNDKGVLATFAAHELGHALGHVFELPGNSGDPRNHPFESVGMNLMGGTQEQLKREYVSELEAWALAEKMIPLDSQAKSFALHTYAQNLK